MIFVTIGTQEPFDRLIKAMDEIAPFLQGEEIIAQASTSEYKAVNIKTLSFLSPVEFNEYFSKAKLVISHAGMGTIISALVAEKPIIVMPRLVKFHEHRNEHQLATANKFKALGYINVANDEDELKEMVINLLKGEMVSLHKLGKYASDTLINSIREYIEL